MTEKSLQRIRLGEVAELYLGYSFRSRLELDSGGKTLVVQMRDLTDRQDIDTESLARVREEGFADTHFLELGDLVFRSRGENNTAAIAAAPFPGPTVLASPLIKIRPKTELVLPRYLQWFINHPIAQAYIERHARGTSVRMVGKESLTALPLILPPLEEQKRIVEFDALALREEAILLRMAALKKTYYQRAIAQTVLGVKRSSHDE